VTCEVAVRIGRDYAAILDYAKTQSIDLIVMGRQGHSDWGKILFGNVTEKVTRHADCAVLVIPLSFRDKPAQG
jgi:nucleotide-binding universal stress UspA family protein